MSVRVDTETRIRTLEKILASGGYAATCRAYARKEWGLSDRQTRRLVSMARERIRADWELERTDFLAQQLSTLTDLQLRAMQRGELAVALGCINAKARLCQLT
jgi:hypothetical protein